MTVINDNNCGWINHLPKRKNFKVLTNNILCDYLIVGAGYTGLSAARKLALNFNSSKIVVVDSQLAGEGSSARNSGYLVDTTLNDGFTSNKDIENYKKKIKIYDEGIKTVEKFVKEYQVDCDWNPCGKYFASSQMSDEKVAIKFSNLLSSLNFENQILYKEDLKKKLEDAKQGDKSKLNMTIEDINRLLLVASKNGNREAVIRLFLNHKVNPNYQNEYGNTPLIVASDHGHDSIVKILLNKGADPNIENTYGWTPIDFAVGYLSEQDKSKKEILDSKLFRLLSDAGGHPGGAFFNLFIEDNNLKDSDKNTRAMRHRVTEPGDDSKSK